MFIVSGKTDTIQLQVLLWRNWIARQTSNLKIAGSSPARSIGDIAQG